jgi:hypothetical protein
MSWELWRRLWGPSNAHGVIDLERTPKAVSLVASKLQQTLPPYRATVVPPIFPIPGGDLASTGLMKELQRVQVQVPGKTVWNDSTANSELALAA